MTPSTEIIPKIGPKNAPAIGAKKSKRVKETFEPASLLKGICKDIYPKRENRNKKNSFFCNCLVMSNGKINQVVGIVNMRNIKLLAWFNFFSDFKLYTPLAIIYLSNVTGSYAQGAAVISIAMLSSAIFEVPTGIFSDFIGRKKTIILGAATSVLYVSLYGLGTSFWPLATAACFEGLARSFYSGNNDAFLHDSLTEKGQHNKYHHYLGRLSSMFQLGLGVSAVLGSLVAARSFAWVFAFSALAQLICFFIALNFKEPKVKGKLITTNVYQHLTDSFKDIVKNAKLRLLTLSSIFSFGFGEASYQFRGAFYIMVWPIWAIGFASMISNFGAIFGFYFSGKIIDKLGGSKILVFSAIYNRFIDFVGLIFAGPLSPLLMTTTSLHYGIAYTAKGAMMQKEFTEHQRATMASIASFGGSICFGLVTVALGIVADSYDPRVALLLLEFLLLLNIYIYWKLFKGDS